MKTSFFSFLVLILFVVIGCQTSDKKEMNQKSELIGMPNPASVYCVQLHGKSTLVNTPQGQYANCTLPSGETIEEWVLYRRDHSQYH